MQDSSSHVTYNLPRDPSHGEQARLALAIEHEATMFSPEGCAIVVGVFIPGEVCA